MVSYNHQCSRCGSEQIVKNGYNSSKNPKYKCKECGFGGVFKSKLTDEATKEQIIKAAQERSSARGLGRIYGLSHTTILRYIKKKPNRFQT